MSSSVTPTWLLDTLVSIVHLLTLAAGVLLAVLARRRQPRAAGLAGTGLALLTVAYALYLVQVLSASANAALVTAVALGGGLLRVAGIVLLAVALVQVRRAPGAAR